MEPPGQVREKGELLPVVRASCSVPGMFHPVWMEGRPYVDGGVADRPGLDGMPKQERVLYHHLLTTARWRKDKTLPDRKRSQRPQLTGLVLQGLPRVGPNALDKGFEAFEAGYRGARKALGQPIDERGHVVVTL